MRKGGERIWNEGTGERGNGVRGSDEGMDGGDRARGRNPNAAAPSGAGCARGCKRGARRKGSSFPSAPFVVAARSFTPAG